MGCSTRDLKHLFYPNTHATPIRCVHDPCAPLMTIAEPMTTACYSYQTSQTKHPHQKPFVILQCGSSVFVHINKNLLSLQESDPLANLECLVMNKSTSPLRDEQSRCTIFHVIEVKPAKTGANDPWSAVRKLS